jgi:D-xylose transport system substrate-binding protein
MRSRLWSFVAIGVVIAGTVTGCDGGNDSAGSGTGGTNKTARVGVIMPDDVSAQRWSQDDPRFLTAAFKAAGVPVQIENAHRDPVRFQRIAHDMVTSGVRVLIIVNVDPVSGRAALADARSHKVPTIDYDRLTLNGGADYYVSFDNEQVGRMQADGLVRCLAARGADNAVVAELNGSPTDSNAAQFKQGYDEQLTARYAKAELTKGPDQSVPAWDTALGGRIFEQMISQRPDIGGVLAANDGLAQSVIEVLRKHGRAGQVPVTGQDATVQGLQSVLAGEQCMTVYKAIKPEADAAAGLAVSLFRGRQPRADDQIKDPESGAYIPFVKREPKAIDARSVKTVVADGFVSRKEICTGRYAALCTKYGV